MLRSWRYPTFGATLEKDELYGTQQLGLPPAVLELSAYAMPTANGSAQSNGLIHRVPVVISSLNISYPTDCDYIPTVHLKEEDALRHIPTGIPFPVIMPIDIGLTESHTPKQYATFSLTDFKRGIMVGF